jgi:hypothetical protein
MNISFKKLLLEKINKTDLENKMLVYITKLEGHIEMFMDERRNLEGLLDNLEKYDLQIGDYIASLNAIVNYAKKTKNLTEATLKIINGVNEGKMLSEITKIEKADNTVMDYLIVYKNSITELNKEFEALDDFYADGDINEISNQYNTILTKIWNILNNLETKTTGFKTKLEEIFNKKGKPRGRGAVNYGNESEEIDDDEEE